MSASSVHFGVTELAIREIHAIERDDSKTFGVAVIKTVLRSLPTVVLKWTAKTVGGWIVTYVENQAAKLAAQAIFFRGARLRLAEERVNAHVDPTDELVIALETLEVHVLQGRAKCLEVVVSLDKINPQSRAAISFRKVITAMAELYEELDQLKWAAMENDADVDLSGPVQTYGDANSLIHSLKN